MSVADRTVRIVAAHSAIATLAAVASPAIAQPCGRFLELQGLDGASFAIATGVSRDGTFAVGYSAVDHGTNLRAVRWNLNGAVAVPQDLGLLPGANWSIAHGVSEDGERVVGYCAGHMDRDRVFVWSNIAGMQEIEMPLDVVSARASAISANGMVVVGNYASATGPLRPFRWTANTGVLEFATLPGDSAAEVFAISGDGQIVVGMSSNPGSIARATRWVADVGDYHIGDLGVVDGSNFSIAAAVSGNGGTTAGYIQTAGGFEQAVFWQNPASPQLIGALPGDDRSFANAISFDGSVIVGQSYVDITASRAFVWTSGTGMQNLGALPGAVSMAALDISGSGHIVVGYAGAPGSTRAFAWVACSNPCPADFNQSTALTPQDIFDFLNAWFTADPRADFNGVSGITPQDIFDFLNAWFAGCP